MPDSASPRELDKDVPEALPPPELHMTFKAEDTPPLPARPAQKKAQSKNGNDRLKARKVTPVPANKGDGRKRFIHSPTPEDKQIRKKIVVGDDEVLNDDVSAELGTILEASGAGEEESDGRADPHKNDCRIMVVATAEPESSPANPEECSHTVMAPAPEMALPTMESAFQPYTVKSGDSIGKQVPEVTNEDKIVNLPNLGAETKVHLERQLAPPYVEESRDLSVPNVHVQPKQNPLLRIAALDSAEMLDCASVQPLLHLPDMVTCQASQASRTLLLRQPNKEGTTTHQGDVDCPPPAPG